MPIGAALASGALVAATGLASPDGAEWETAADPEGCQSCHLGSPDPEESPALTLEGLPERPEAGGSYTLTIVLDDPAIRNTGFLLSIGASGGAPGELSALDERVEAMGTLARSTYAGSEPAEPGRARWEVVWTMPEPIPPMFGLSLWANAGNDDLSPLGDRLHHRRWQLAPRR